MSARLAADGLVAIHFAFIAFVIGGGLLTFWHRRWAWLHVPALAWAAWTEFTATVCPLTPWENALRAAAGDAGYAESFIDHYIVPVIYPAGLTPSAQIGLGFGIVALNIIVYAFVWRRSLGARIGREFRRAT